MTSNGHAPGGVRTASCRLLDRLRADGAVSEAVVDEGDDLSGDGDPGDLAGPLGVAVVGGDAGEVASELGAGPPGAGPPTTTLVLLLCSIYYRRHSTTSVLSLMKRIAVRCRKWRRSWRTCVQRGDVYETLPPRRMGHEQQGRRCGIVVQADALLPRSVVLIAPTSRSALPASFRPEVVVQGEVTRVLVEQVGAVDVNGLGARVGLASPEEMWGIDESLMTVLGLR
jgi:mRNA interferase MazF